MIQVVDREIMLSEADRQIGVVGDNGVKTLKFEMPKIQGEVDLSSYSAWVLVERMESLGSPSYSSATTKSVNGDKIVISWTISSNETANYGYIYALIKFATTDETPPVWQTERVMFIISKGINGETSADALETNIFNQQVALLQGMIDDGTEEITEIVESFVAPSIEDIDGLTEALNSKADDDRTGLYTTLGIPDPQPGYTVPNAVVNGHFTENTTGWSAVNSTLSASNGRLIVTGNGGGAEPQASKSLGTNYIAQNDKLFVSCLFKALNADIERATIYMYGGTGSTSKAQNIAAAAAGQKLPTDTEYTWTGVITVDTTVVQGTARIYLSTKYATAAASTNKQSEFDVVFVANLTTIFGAGNEPSAAQFEASIKAVNSNAVYYDGTKTVRLIYASNGKVPCGSNNEIVWKSIPEILQETEEQIVTAESLSIEDTENQFETDNVGAALKETKAAVDLIDPSAIENTFDKIAFYDDIQDPLAVPSPGWHSAWAGGLFSGWGVEIGAAQNFDTLVFKFRNQSGNEPITTIRVYLFEVNADYSLTQMGNYVSVTGLSISYDANGTTFYFPLGQTITNTEGKTLFASFRCNKTIDIWAGDCGTVLYPTNSHAPVYYTINGTLGGTHVAVSGSGSTTNKIKPMLYACTKKFYLSPKDIFTDNLPYQQPVTVRVSLPAKYDAVVGDTLQIFYRGIVEAVNPYVYNIEVLYYGSNGKAYPRYFELTPVAGDVGTHSLTVNVRDNADNILGTATCNIVVTAVGSSPASAVNILNIGDSLSAAGTWITEARRRLVGTGGSPAGNALTNINFIGTVRAGDNSHGWEGYGGWTWTTYQTAPSATTLDMWVYCSHDKTIADQRSLWKDAGNDIWELETIEETRIKFTRYNGHTAAMPTGSGTLTHYLNATHTGNISYTSTAAGGGNPFWNNALSRNDFQNYCTANGYGGIDYAYILLGWNQIAKFRPEAVNHAALITSAKSFVDRLHTDYPNAKVKIIGLQMPSLNGGIGTNYGASGNYSNCYGLIRSIGGLNLAYAAWAAESAYSSFVNFIQLSGQFDSENNMPQSAIAVNTRSSTTELRGTNGVHPATAGYYQIADASYRDMVFELS